jgi:CheY-like chemotaxis protein
MAEVLIVDDDEEIRTLLRLLLNSANYGTAEAAGGDEAVALLRREAFSLVLLDVTMPGRDGFEVGAEIRTFSNVPILYLTARGQEYDKIRGVAAGGDEMVGRNYIAAFNTLFPLFLCLLRLADTSGFSSREQNPYSNTVIFETGEDSPR